MEERTGIRDHACRLENRNAASLTGVREVVSFDENQVVMDTDMGLLTIKGKDLDRGLGSELDLQVDWQIMKDVKLSAGYSTMLGTSTMEAVKGGSKDSWQDWGWLSININPRIFIAKW